MVNYDRLYYSLNKYWRPITKKDFLFMDYRESFEIYHAFAPEEAKEWVAPVRVGIYGK